MSEMLDTIVIFILLFVSVCLLLALVYKKKEYPMKEKTVNSMNLLQFKMDEIINQLNTIISLLKPIVAESKKVLMTEEKNIIEKDDIIVIEDTDKEKRILWE